MEYKEALDILIKMAGKSDLTAKEKQAILTAIGVLDMATIAKNRYKMMIKSQKAKKEKGTQW
jgi:hypothetical protein